MYIIFVKNCLAVGNPFFEAYIHSDFLGRLIFIALIALSIGSWALLVHKIILTKKARESSEKFKKIFNNNREQLLTMDEEKKELFNPFCNLYHALRLQTLEILNKNRLFGSTKEKSSYLSASDIDVVEARLAATVANETQFLEKNIFILATIVTLAPFLGLLGTVWGILTTFSEMQMQSGGNTNQVVLGGLSLALATTVLGLVDAIPALIGYNYLKSTIRHFRTEMESFSHEMLTTVELQYRKVD